jgi:hypothetical protein
MSIQNLYPAISPSLSLDFANVQQLDPRITFTRASTATYYGTQTAKAEENLLLQSQTFETTWSVIDNVSVTANTTTAPDGTATADTLAETAVTGIHATFQSSSVTGVLTLSVFAKPDSGTPFLTIGISSSGTSHSSATFDLSLGTNTQTQANGGNYTSPSATITAVAQGFYRCTFTVTTTDTATLFRIGLNNTGTPTASNRGFGATYLGVVTNSIFIWGAQLEQRSAVTAYTPTTTQPITNYIPVLQTAASGVARFDHNPTTFESLGLLIEESRSNLVLQSEDFSTTWAATRSTVATNQVVAPSGALTADILQDSTDNDTHFVSQTFTGTAASHTFSVYAKASGLNHVALRLFNGTSQVGLAYYNLSTGATGTVTAGTAAITSVGNGYYRCSLTATLAASASCTADIQLANADNSNSFIGNAFDGVTLWGTQVELGAFPTSYIPTVASQVTRASDAASMTGTNFSSWYSQGQGTLYAESTPLAAPLTTPSRPVFHIRNAGGTSYIDLRYRASQKTSAIVVLSNVTQVDISSTANYTTASGKIASTYATNNVTFTFNAETVKADTSVTIPTDLSQAYFGTDSTSLFNGTIKKLAYYPMQVTNAQLQALTS